MAQAKVNPNSLADTLKNRSLQSQIQRFLDGKTKHPRWETLKPVADYLGIRVEALFDSEVAIDTAIQRGLIETHTVREDVAVYRIDNRATPNSKHPPKPTLLELLIQLGEELQPFDISARKAVASLLADIALAPDDAGLTAARITRLLGATGNSQAPESTNSPPEANALKRNG